MIEPSAPPLRSSAAQLADASPPPIRDQVGRPSPLSRAVAVGRAEERLQVLLDLRDRAPPGPRRPTPAPCPAPGTNPPCPSRSTEISSVPSGMSGRRRARPRPSRRSVSSISMISSRSSGRSSRWTRPYSGTSCSSSRRIRSVADTYGLIPSSSKCGPVPRVVDAGDDPVHQVLLLRHLADQHVVLVVAGHRDHHVGPRDPGPLQHPELRSVPVLDAVLELLLDREVAVAVVLDHRHLVALVDQLPREVPARPCPAPMMMMYLRSAISQSSSPRRPRCGPAPRASRSRRGSGRSC